ncbi:MAG: hypothetical protein AB1444_15580 [Spirochaetota bacterium]
MYFNDISQLFDHIQDDLKKRGYYTRFPVRFIFLNDYSQIKALLDYYETSNVIIKDLTREIEIFQQNNDAWITINDILRIINIIKSSGEISFAIILLSEIVRFYKDNEFYSLFQSLLEIENSSNENLRRIYIPLVGIKARFDAIFWNKYIRKKEWDPLWEVNSNEKNYNLFLTDMQYDFKSFDNITLINNSLEYLNLYKKDYLNEKLIVTSNTINSLYANSIDYGIFQVKKNQYNKRFN